VAKLELFSHYNKKTVLVRFIIDNQLHDSKNILSEELSEMIHQLSGWKTFDTATLNEIVTPLLHFQENRLGIYWTE